MDERRFGISEAVGAVAIYAAAVVLHYVYALSGGGTLAAIFGAVNESVWEHVKIFTVSYCGWAILQLLWLRVPFRRYVAAKVCGLYLLAGGMIGFSYLYTAISGRPIPPLDIVSSAVLVAAAQLCSCLLPLRWRGAGEYFSPAVMLLMLYYLMFLSFTVSPPPIGLFRDPLTGGHGIA